jgi:hypothetical protein
MAAKGHKPMDPRKALEMICDALYPMNAASSAKAMRRAIIKADKVLDKYYRSIANGEGSFVVEPPTVA